MPSVNSNKYGLLIFLVLLLGMLTFWGIQLTTSLTIQYEGEWEQFWGFIRWLLGYVVLLGGLILLAWLNFRFPYLSWAIHKEKRWFYRSWVLVLTMSIYLLLEWRTYFEPEWTEENLLISFLCVGLILGFTEVAALIRNRNQHNRLLQQQTAAELSALRAQLNPHFLFNALNTLYNQAIQSQDSSLAERVLELSGILRFSLEQSSKNWVSIEEELTFVQRYIALQQARLIQPAQMEVEIEWDEVDADIPPLLLLPFVENFYKYGIPGKDQGAARMKLLVEEQQLLFSTNNPLPSRPIEAGTGRGIDLVKKRLELRFPRQHSLEIKSNEDRFQVNLHIQLPPRSNTHHRMPDM